MKTISIPPALTFKMYELISGYWIACGIHAVSKLNIADHLYKRPLSVEELGVLADADPDTLYRLLRAMASVGIFEEDAEKKFHLNDFGATLLSDVPGSVKAWALANLGEHFPAFGHLTYGIKTGNVPFEDIYGMSVWDYYKQNPIAGENLMKSMTGVSGAVIQEVIEAYDFSPFKSIVDIGGGNGALLFGILGSAQNSIGTVFDEPYVIEKTKSFIPDSLIERCSVAGGSFFEEIPADADAYVMKWVLHDWNNEESIAILKVCRQAMHRSSKLLIIDAVIPDEDKNVPHPGKLLDLNIFAMTTGRERTREEFKHLVTAAGLTFKRIIPTSSEMVGIVECEKID